LQLRVACFKRGQFFTETRLHLATFITTIYWRHQISATPDILRNLVSFWFLFFLHFIARCPVFPDLQKHGNIVLLFF